MLNPTGGKIRNDVKGSGLFNAPRGNDRKHDGIDLIVKPGHKVLSPIDGLVTRQARPYAHENYSGLEIEGDRITVVLFYLRPLKGIVGSQIEKGDIIGIAQDISKRYGKGMIPHIHLRITRCDPVLLMGMP